MITFYIILYISGILLSLRDKDLMKHVGDGIRDKLLVIALCLINIFLFLTMYQIFRWYQVLRYYILSRIAIWKVKRLLKKWSKRDGVDYGKEIF